MLLIYYLRKYLRIEEITEMSKTPIPNIPQPKRDSSGRIRRLRKLVSHGTFRCKRKPNSPRCKKLKGEE